MPGIVCGGLVAGLGVWCLVALKPSFEGCKHNLGVSTSLAFFTLAACCLIPDCIIRLSRPGARRQQCWAVIMITVIISMMIWIAVLCFWIAYGSLSLLIAPKCGITWIIWVDLIIFGILSLCIACAGIGSLIGLSIAGYESFVFYRKSKKYARIYELIYDDTFDAKNYFKGFSPSPTHLTEMDFDLLHRHFGFKMKVDKGKEKEALEAKVNQCLICLNRMRDGQQVIRHPTCNHIFHSKCLERYYLYEYSRRGMPRMYLQGSGSLLDQDRVYQFYHSPCCKTFTKRDMLTVINDMARKGEIHCRGPRNEMSNLEEYMLVQESQIT